MTLTVGQALAPVLRRWPELVDWPARMANEDPRAVADVARTVGVVRGSEAAGEPPAFADFLDAVRIQAGEYRGEPRPEQVDRDAMHARADRLARALLEQAPEAAKPGGQGKEERRAREGAWVQLRAFAAEGVWNAPAEEQIWRFCLLVTSLRRVGVAAPCPEMEPWIAAAEEGVGVLNTRVWEMRGTGRDPVVELPSRVRWLYLAEVLLAGFGARARPEVPTGFRGGGDGPEMPLLYALLAKHETDGRMLLPGWMRAVASRLPRRVESEEDVHDPGMQIAAADAYRELEAAGRVPPVDELRRVLGSAVWRGAMEVARERGVATPPPEPTGERDLLEEARRVLARSGRADGDATR
jgi:hypothetical protein